MTPHYIIVSIPGDDDRGDETFWYIMDRNTHRSLYKASSFEDAKATLKNLLKIA